MSYQSYLDNIEKQTGKTPNEIISLSKRKGFNQDTKTMEIVSWLKADLGIGHGHAMAMAGVIKNGPIISSKHVNTNGTHSDPNETLFLDGIARRKKDSTK